MDHPCVLFRIVLTGILRNREVIGCMDCPRVLFWIVPAKSPKNKRVFWIGPIFFFLSFLTQCYYPHTSRKSVFPLCGIFSYHSRIFLLDFGQKWGCVTSRHSITAKPAERQKKLTIFGDGLARPAECRDPGTTFCTSGSGTQGSQSPNSANFNRNLC